MKIIPIRQNVDRNVSARDYEHLHGALAVTSYFRTLQGEGPFAGRTSVFLRLAGCNYGSKTDMCSWCDTSFQLDQALTLTVDSLATLLVEERGSKEDILVVTGGEPTMQTALLDLIVKLQDEFAEIQIETNGTQPKFFEEAERRGMTGHDFTTVVSPKANERLGKYPLLAAKVMWWANDLKFVVSADPTSPHHEVPEYVALNRHKRLWVSPMAVYKKAYSGEVSSIWDDELIDREATAANYAYAAQYALKHNLRLSLQQHLFVAIA